MARGSNWTWEETLVAFRLYCRTPFGKLHQHNPVIVALADLLGRTPSAVAMKACNFASLDPVQRARGIKGLSNRSRFESILWEQFHADSEAVATEAEEAYERITSGEAIADSQPLVLPPGPTEVSRTVRVRRVQSFFRSAVMASYGYRCAVTGLAIPNLLNASHIVPWSVSSDRRADPSNGLCLNALHDRAFDNGLITLTDELTIALSPVLRVESDLGDLSAALMGYDACSIRVPDRFAPDPTALAYHREHVFKHTATMQ
jgi:hypothetical protein